MIKQIFFEGTTYLGNIILKVCTVDIDNIHEISALDTGKMFEMVYTWPELIENILQQSIDIPYTTDFTKIIISGMGGSAIGGDYIKTYFEKSLPIPIIIIRNYNLPAFIDAKTLVIVISYSGNTEETISCLIDAVQSNCAVIGIGSGGKIENYCNSAKIPYFKIPAGFQPRASLPLLFFPVLKIFDILKIANMNQEVNLDIINQLINTRDLLKPEIPTGTNEAKQIALKLFNRIPIIWSPLLCISRRFRCQINENAKQLAFAEELPEFNHNHIVGFEGLSSNNPFTIVAFRFPHEHPNVSLRFEITKEIVQKFVDIHEITIHHNNFLTQMVVATYIGDYISMYLAILNDQDPNTVDSVDFLKNQLELRGNT